MRIWIRVGVLLLLVASACQVDLGGPEPFWPPIPTANPSSDDLIQTWEGVVKTAAKTGEVVILLDEIQLTTYLVQQFQRSKYTSFQELQVFLRENAIRIYGVLSHGLFSARFLVSVTPSVDPNGALGFELSHADMGPLPAPNALKDTISAMLTEFLTGAIGSRAAGVRITTLAIVDGQMGIVGELR